METTERNWAQFNKGKIKLEQAKIVYYLIKLESHKQTIVIITSSLMTGRGWDFANEYLTSPPHCGVTMFELR